METKFPWVSHGIQNEGSDWRVHVCPGWTRWQRGIYFFPTPAAIEVMNKRDYPTFMAQQAGFEGGTGMGRRVPWDHIPGCLDCNPPGYVWDLSRWNVRDSTSEKGAAAQKLVIEVLESGFVTIGVPFCDLSKNLSETTFRVVNRWKFGHDIEVWRKGVRYRLEIKCDFPGTKEGLALQTAERNPLKRF